MYDPRSPLALVAGATLVLLASVSFFELQMVILNKEAPQIWADDHALVVKCSEGSTPANDGKFIALEGCEVSWPDLSQSPEFPEFAKPLIRNYNADAGEQAPGAAQVIEVQSAVFEKHRGFVVYPPAVAKSVSTIPKQVASRRIEAKPVDARFPKDHGRLGLRHDQTWHLPQVLLAELMQDELRADKQFMELFPDDVGRPARSSYGQFVNQGSKTDVVTSQVTVLNSTTLQLVQGTCGDRCPPAPQNGDLRIRFDVERAPVVSILARQVVSPDGSRTFAEQHLCFWRACHDVAWIFHGSKTAHEMAMSRWPTVDGLIFFEEGVVFWAGLGGLLLAVQHLATPGSAVSVLTLANSGPPPRIGEILAPCIATWVGLSHLLMAIVWSPLHLFGWVIWYCFVAFLAFTVAGFGFLRVKAASASSGANQVKGMMMELKNDMKSQLSGQVQ
eukprot:CAMPEP_0204280504 /NCGR_PEP_ID=MMETSP0468-20130131/38344_1 /ASSEMBLY_ACC=CAM_ASM_000383 /TAXON_ID=2969 /ORGANISM="Oxyrrhis marina" /LENGTH=444 /DNA_ID=CAMNT_0051257733 /DNA_START=37 /DNA_END=1371 /DNA_ORIENTATION=+